MTAKLVAAQLLEWTPSWTRLRKRSSLAYCALLGRGSGSLLVVPDRPPDSEAPVSPLMRYVGASVLGAIPLATAVTAALVTALGTIAPAATVGPTVSVLIGLAITLLVLPIFQVSFLSTQLRILVPNDATRLQLLKTCGGRAKLFGHVCTCLSIICVVGASFAWHHHDLRRRHVRHEGTIETLEAAGLLSAAGCPCSRNSARATTIRFDRHSLGLVAGATVHVRFPEQKRFTSDESCGWKVSESYAEAVPLGDEIPPVLRSYPRHYTATVAAGGVLPPLLFSTMFFGEREADAQIERGIEQMSIVIEGHNP